ncbi:esterase 1 [Mycena epipterygia]|nr:esterase 1 [Mycena epipterygia]
MNSLIISLFCVVTRVLATSPTITLGETVLHGNPQVPGQEFFGGIPYAEPPVGDLRFRLPVLKTSLGVDTFDATEFGLACLQSPPNTKTPSSEDCLTVNVIRPAGLSAHELLPVLVWVHGGAFEGGASSLFNGSQIVAQGISRGTPIIFVSFNYRLGPLGFAPGQEAADAGILNLGLRDSMVAFQWVQDNIETFGGDRTKTQVTTFGISSGAIMIANLMLNPEMKNFVRGMIFGSGSPAGAPSFNASHRQDDWDHFVQAIPECQSTRENSTSLECLRTVDSSALVNAITVATGQANTLLPWAPTIDGPGGVIPDLQSKLLQAGTFAHLPFIAGDVLDEGSAFVPSTTNSTDMIKDGLLPYYSVSTIPDPIIEAALDKLLELYPDIPALGCPYNTGNDTFGLNSQFKRYAAIFGDLVFIAQRRALSQIAAGMGIKSFGYIFTDPPPPNLVPPFFGVFHAEDADYLFGSLPSLNGSASAIHLAEVMIDYWISFTTSLDPNDGRGTARPNWSEYSSEKPVLMQLNGENTTLVPDDFRVQQLEFINSNPIVFRR